MKHPCSNALCLHGASLIEAVIAIGVLAVAIPVVFGTLAEAGKNALAAQAETRSTWMIPTCMNEIRASRAGHPQYFTPTTPGQKFPPTGEIWALAFSPEGQPIGRLSQAFYDKGTKELNGKTVRYIAAFGSSMIPVNHGTTPMMRVDISLEFPAAAVAAKRRKLDFHTRIP
jgi:type II secretory pathway pseudopilin PulG